MKTIKTLFLVSCSLFAQLGWAQKIEAETATLAGGAAIQSCTSCSGGSMVAQQEGNISFTFNKTASGYVDIYIMAAGVGGDKMNILNINGATSEFSTVGTAYSRTKVSSSLRLAAGTHSIKILKSWGWINVDYIELVSVAAPVYNINPSLVTPNPTPEVICLYQFLKDNYGKKIVSGVMTLFTNDEVDWLKQNVGKEPALVGIDFLFTNRNYNWYSDNTPVTDAINYYKRNGIPAMCWHWRDPSRRTEAFYSQSGNATDYTTFDITKVNDPSSSEYTAMLSDIDFVAGQLKRAQAANTPILWRPLHEAGGGWFWWGKDGASCKKLWQLMYDRMVNYHQLRNLIWVYTKQPNDDAFYPGDEYVDIIGRDYYNTGDHSSVVGEFTTISSKFGNKKLVALSECGSSPDPDNLVKDDAKWSWFMPWNGDFVRSATYNSLDFWKKAFGHDYVLTLDEMPSLKTCSVITSATEEQTGMQQSLAVYPTHVKDFVTVKSTELVEKVAVYNLAGVLQLEQSVFAHQFDLSMSNLVSGAYFLKVNGHKTVKLLKE
jgi:mannan endo-1,4-beta-mannosidase